MKTLKIGRLLNVAVIVASLGLAALTANAQRAPDTARGGTALLNELNSPKSIVAAAKAFPMACPKCVDTVLVKPDLSSKGGARGLLDGGVPKMTVAKHGCGQCSTKITVEGHGKAQYDIRKHTCPDCG
jgi:DNA-directed RNA polymerase subunit RPC12/RpoP